MTWRFFAPCPRGLEVVLATELEPLGARAVYATEGGVAFEGEPALLYRVNLHSRIASRILLHVGASPYRNEDDVYRAARSIRWHEWFDRGRTFRVALAAVRSPLRSLDFATLRIKDGVCDAFRDHGGARPDIDTRNPDIRIHAFLSASDVNLYVDTSGEPLFKRGWRTGTIDAPLRENLAAGILQLGGWRPGLTLLDPMCGGGTFLSEAATLALDMAPGMDRGFAFERLALYQPRLWREVREQAAAQRKPVQRLPIFGSDHDPRAIRATQAALRRAGLESAVALERADILDRAPPAPTGIMVANPPYGVRIGEQDALAAFYPKLGDALKQRFTGWRCFFFTADTRMPKLIGLRPARRTPLFNGALECRLYEFAIVAGRPHARRADTPPA